MEQILNSEHFVAHFNSAESLHLEVSKFFDDIVFSVQANGNKQGKFGFVRKRHGRLHYIFCLMFFDHCSRNWRIRFSNPGIQQFHVLVYFGRSPNR